MVIEADGTLVVRTASTPVARSGPAAGTELIADAL